MRKKILITGVAGFIGSHVAKKFIDEKYEVFGIDDLSTGYKKNVPKGVKFIKADLSSKQTYKSLPKSCDYILHLAGQSSGEISFSNPISDLEKNTVSTIRLIKYGIKSKTKKFLFASSMSVYGKLKKNKFKETDGCYPLSCYGASKLSSEKYLEIFKEKLPYVSLRMFSVYGPGQDMKNLKQGMISIYLAQAMKNKKVIVKGSLNRERDFIYIDDVVECWFRAVLNKQCKNITINIGTGKSVKVKKLLNLIKKILDVKVKLAGPTFGDQDKVCSNNYLMKTKLKIKKFTSLNTGLKYFINTL